MDVEELIGYLHARGWKRSIEQRSFSNDREPRQVFVWRHPELDEAGSTSDAANALELALAQQIKAEPEPSALELQLRSWLNERGWRYSRSYGDIAGNKRYAELHVYERTPETLDDALGRIAAVSGDKIADDLRDEVERMLRTNPSATIDDLNIWVPQLSDLDKLAADPNRLVPLVRKRRTVAYQEMAALMNAVASQLHDDGYNVNIYEQPTRGRKLADSDFGGLGL